MSEYLLPTEILRVGEEDLSTIIDRAAEIILKGGLVVYPTDTSYGVGCDPRQPDAVERLIVAKKRDPSYGVPLLFADQAQCEDYHEFLELEKVLTKLFWPGVLTLVVSAKQEVSAIVTGDRDSIAVRVPKHDVPRGIARKIGAPIVGTSANLTGEPSPFDVSAAQEQLGDSVDLYIDGGASEARANSTIVGVVLEGDQGHIKVYREGELTVERLIESLRVDSDALRFWTSHILQADM